MSALARIEIAATPAEVRRVFLDFPGWPKIGDKVIKAMTPANPSEPIVPGSKILANVAGNNMTVVVTENSPQTFSWRSMIFGIFGGNRTFQFLPSEKTPGHTTFVNAEKFERLFWALVVTGVMKEQAAFEAFNGKFKTRVEEELSKR